MELTPDILVTRFNAAFPTRFGKTEDVLSGEEGVLIGYDELDHAFHEGVGAASFRAKLDSVYPDKIQKSTSVMGTLTSPLITSHDFETAFAGCVTTGTFRRKLNDAYPQKVGENGLITRAEFEALFRAIPRHPVSSCFTLSFHACDVTAADGHRFLHYHPTRGSDDVPAVLPMAVTLQSLAFANGATAACSFHLLRNWPAGTGATPATNSPCLLYKWTVSSVRTETHYIAEPVSLDRGDTLTIWCADRHLTCKDPHLLLTFTLRE